MTRREIAEKIEASTMNKLVLFDIDKTLISGNRSHIAAFSEAFKRVYGLDADIAIINHHGMTDQQIIIEVLKKKGLGESEIKSKLENCMKAMVESFNEIISSDEIIILAGVRELLRKLDENNILMGLVTGNLELIARGKLKKVGLNNYFKIGGFGSDDKNRTNLVNLAIKRAEENAGFTFNNNVFLFGDTPRDIEAAQEAGVKTIGVATGIYSEEQLKDAGADFVLGNLKDAKKVLEIISN